LFMSLTAYVARTPQRQELRFSVSGDPTIERLYRTHWVSPELSERKRQRLAEKVNRPPDLVVIQPRNTDWKCHRCGRTGDLLVMEMYVVEEVQMPLVQAHNLMVHEWST
jgi:hypothetical protein